MAPLRHHSRPKSVAVWILFVLVLALTTLLAYNLRQLRAHKEVTETGFFQRESFLEDCQEQLQQKSVDWAAKLDDVERLQKEMKELTEHSKETEKLLGTRIEEVTRLQKEKSEQEAKIQQMRQDLDQRVAEITDRFNEKVLEKEKQLQEVTERLNQKLSDKERQLQEVQAHLTEARGQLDAADKRVRVAEDQATEARHQQASAQEQLKALKEKEAQSKQKVEGEEEEEEEEQDVENDGSDDTKAVNKTDMWLNKDDSVVKPKRPVRKSWWGAW